jgi:hypothetical protein
LAQADEATNAFMRNTILGCNLAGGLVIFKDTRKHDRPLIFWNAVRDVFRAWSAL